MILDRIPIDRRDIVSMSIDGKGRSRPWPPAGFRALAVDLARRRPSRVRTRTSLAATGLRPVARGAGRAAVSASGGAEPRWAPGENEIYY